MTDPFVKRGTKNVKDTQVRCAVCRKKSMIKRCKCDIEGYLICTTCESNTCVSLDISKKRMKHICSVIINKEKVAKLKPVTDKQWDDDIFIPDSMIQVCEYRTDNANTLSKEVIPGLITVMACLARGKTSVRCIGDLYFFRQCHLHWAPREDGEWEKEDDLLDDYERMENNLDSEHEK
jgi:hypothetical protein